MLGEWMAKHNLSWTRATTKYDAPRLKEPCRLAYQAAFPNAPALPSAGGNEQACSASCMLRELVAIPER